MKEIEFDSFDLNSISNRKALPEWSFPIFIKFILDDNCFVNFFEVAKAEQLPERDLSFLRLVPWLCGRVVH